MSQENPPSMLPNLAFSGCAFLVLAISTAALARTYPGCKTRHEPAYCEGTYAELIDSERYQQNGQFELLPTRNVTDFINEEGRCALSDGYLLTPGGSADLTTMSRIVIAKALEERFRLAWEPDADGNCVLSYVLVEKE